eukprot:3042744-Pleurochrysis_carterae.AAC.2
MDNSRELKLRHSPQQPVHFVWMWSEARCNVAANILSCLPFSKSARTWLVSSARARSARQTARRRGTDPAGRPSRLGSLVDVIEKRNVYGSLSFRGAPFLKYSRIPRGWLDV